MEKKEIPKYIKELEKLRGREAEFALQLIEYITGHPFMEDVECDFGIHPERMEKWDRDKLLKHYRALYLHISPIYTIAHSFNTGHSCHNAHDVWRDGAIELYKSYVDEGMVCHDDFNLFGEDEIIELDESDYQSVWIGEPDDLSEFTTMAKDGVQYNDGSSDVKHTQLVLIRSRQGGNKFLAVSDYKNDIYGKIVTIDEEKLINRLTAEKAWRLLSDTD